jgi:hypothetical protein
MNICHTSNHFKLKQLMLQEDHKMKEQERNE